MFCRGECGSDGWTESDVTFGFYGNGGSIETEKARASFLHTIRTSNGLRNALTPLVHISHPLSQASWFAVAVVIRSLASSKLTSIQFVITMTITVSAPGKILLAGGYLVLESPNIGLVVGVDKRFYSTVQLKKSDKGEEPFVLIVVKSPQFQQVWRYSYQKASNTLSPDNSSNTSSNPFVEKTLGSYVA